MAWEALGLDYRCPRCAEPFESCSCTCPFCGETWRCTCCIGYGRATGG